MKAEQLYSADLTIDLTDLHLEGDSALKYNTSILILLPNDSFIVTTLGKIIQNSELGRLPQELA